MKFKTVEYVEADRELVNNNQTGMPRVHDNGQKSDTHYTLVLQLLFMSAFLTFVEDHVSKPLLIDWSNSKQVKEPLEYTPLPPPLD